MSWNNWVDIVNGPIRCTVITELPIVPEDWEALGVLAAAVDRAAESLAHREPTP